MKLQVNDKPLSFQGSTLAELLTTQNIHTTTGVAVAVNEAVVPKGEWQQFELQEADSVLIIKPTQGG